jgi:hypothetical protein
MCPFKLQGKNEKNQFKHMATHASFKNYLKSNKHILDGGHYLPPSPLWMELNNRHPQYIHSFWNMWFKFKLV